MSPVRTTHPPVRGEIWERRRGARRVEITEAGRADVHGRWLDTRKRCVWPARGFTERFRPALDNADFRAALPERRRRLIDEQRDLLTGRTVLELGPHTGGLTVGLARYARRSRPSRATGTPSRSWPAGSAAACRSCRAISTAGGPAQYPREIEEFL